MNERLVGLARQAVRELAPYSSARSLGIQGEVYLDANENPWQPPGGDLGRVNRYPEPQPAELLAVLSALYQVGREQILMGRGTDEAIDTLVRAFCESGQDSILITPPTYGVYEVAARLQGAGVVSVPTSMERGFAVDPDAVLSAWRPGVKLVFLCSPNNPTGNLIAEDVITAVARGLSEKALVVLDEAYIEFSGTESLIPRLGEFPNLVLLRTLSKAWALAGARCGVALAAKEIIAVLQKVRAPYPLSLPATQAILSALSGSGQEIAAERVARLVQARERLSSELAELSQVEKVFPSAGNFILVKTTDAGSFLKACLAKGIVVRDRSREVGLEDCVRISVGSEGENERLIQALKAAADG